MERRSLTRQLRFQSSLYTSLEYSQLVMLTLDLAHHLLELWGSVMQFWRRYTQRVAYRVIWLSSLEGRGIREAFSSSTLVERSTWRLERVASLWIASDRIFSSCRDVTARCAFVATRHLLARFTAMRMSLTHKFPDIRHCRSVHHHNEWESEPNFIRHDSCQIIKCHIIPCRYDHLWMGVDPLGNCGRVVEPYCPLTGGQCNGIDRK